MHHLHAIRHFILALGLGLAILASGCGGDKKDNGYPAEVRTNFMNECTSTGGSKSQCSCAWDKITDQFSYDEFVEIEDSIRDGSGGEELVPIIEACIDN